MIDPPFPRGLARIPETTLNVTLDDPDGAIDALFAGLTSRAVTLATPGRWPLPGWLTIGALLSGSMEVTPAAFAPPPAANVLAVTLSPTGPATRTRVLFWRGNPTRIRWGARTVDLSPR